jgi:hypothetical protein
MSDLTCEQCHELAAELALDLLTGRERAVALAHVNRCDACRNHVGSLTAVGDRLLGVVPGVEPPVGFEDRVLTRIGLTRPGRRLRDRRWLPIAVAAAAVALVFGLGGWAVGSLAGPSATTAAPAHLLRVAELHTGDQHGVGQVFTYQGNAAHGDPSWMYMTVSVGAGTPDVSCELARRDGSFVPMGTFPLAGGHGGWGGELPVDATLITGARLLSPSGAVVATATFDDPPGHQYPSGSGH